jgi:hypothetical protein
VDVINHIKIGLLMDNFPTQSENNEKWITSEWYKEWERLSRCIENQKPVGFWCYDSKSRDYIYEKFR